MQADPKYTKQYIADNKQNSNSDGFRYEFTPRTKYSDWSFAQQLLFLSNNSLVVFLQSKQSLKIIQKEQLNFEMLFLKKEICSEM
jgi:hypothetical protein